MKRTLSLILSIIMLLSTLCPTVFAQDNMQTTITTYVTVSKYGEILDDKNGNPIVSTEVSLSGKDLYTLEDVFITLHENLCEEGIEGFEVSEGDYGPYVTKFWGDTSENFIYQVNFGAEIVLGPSHEIEDGDYIEFCINKNYRSDTETYTKFDKTDATIYVGEFVELTLYQASYTADGMAFSPCSDAIITVNGEITQYTTDAEGMVCVEFDSPGKYVVSATKTKLVEDETVPAISAPFCIVSVEELPETQIMHNIVAKYLNDNIADDGNMHWFIADFADYLTIYPDTDIRLTDKQKQKCMDKIIELAWDSSSQGDLAKAIIALRSMGYDAKNTYTKAGTSFDIVAKLISMIDEESVNAPYYEYTLPYVLIALQQGSDFEADETIDFLLTFAIENKTVWQDTTWGVDCVTPMLRALAPYYKTNEAVETAIDESLELVKAYQGENGSTGNASSTGIAIAGVSSVGINPETFYKSDKTLIDGLMDEANESFDGFLPDDNSFGTEQGLRGLNGWKLFSTGKYIYDFKDYPANEARATEEKTVISGGFSGGGSSGGKNKDKDKENDEKTEPTAPIPETTVGLPNKNPDVLKPEIIYSHKTFDDIQEHNNQKAILELASRGIINGVDNKNYCPDNSMTRAEFATIVVRALGVPQESTLTFMDVTENDWFSKYVSTAYRYGIVNGVSETQFNPMGKITREEAATMVLRAAKLCGMVTALNEDSIRNTLALFTDYKTSSDWAKESLAFCYNESIFDNNDLAINPLAEITRAEVAQMLYNMLNKAKLI